MERFVRFLSLFVFVFFFNCVGLTGFFSGFV